MLNRREVFGNNVLEITQLSVTRWKIIQMFFHAEVIFPFCFFFYIRLTENIEISM